MTTKTKMSQHGETTNNTTRQSIHQRHEQQDHSGKASTKYEEYLAPPKSVLVV
jgi:hypothetical protein